MFVREEKEGRIIIIIFSEFYWRWHHFSNSKTCVIQNLCFGRLRILLSQSTIHSFSFFFSNKKPFSVSINHHIMASISNSCFLQRSRFSPLYTSSLAPILRTSRHVTSSPPTHVEFSPLSRNIVRSDNNLKTPGLTAEILNRRGSSGFCTTKAAAAAADAEGHDIVDVSKGFVLFFRTAVTTEQLSGHTMFQ